MKKILITSLFLILISVAGQAGRSNVPEDLESAQSQSVQENLVTATTTRSTRLFGAKDDLTTVILVIPSGSVVTILGTDSTYFQVAFEENEGYIFKKHATIDKSKASQSQFNPRKVSEEAQNQHNTEARNQQNQNQYNQQNQQNQNNNQTQQNQYEQQALQGNQNQGMNRFSYLENKYGTNMATKLISGKIWKGMNTEMVKDSWGKAQKINRVISGNTIKEEWIYRNSWLYFENDELIEWGAAKR